MPVGIICQCSPVKPYLFKEVRFKFKALGKPSDILASEANKRENQAHTGTDLEIKVQAGAAAMHMAIAIIV